MNIKPKALALVLGVECCTLSALAFSTSLKNNNGMGITTVNKISSQSRETSLTSTSTSTSLTMASIDRRSLLHDCIGTGATLAAATFASSSTSLLLPEPAVASTATATATASPFPTWTLDNNVQFPTLALNTVALSVDDTERAIGLALKEGFTHVDFHPGKERDGTAQYLAAHPEDRARLFLNTKIRKPKPGTSASDAAQICRDQIEEDLKILNVAYVDMLMLRDSPDCDAMQAQWEVLEEALAKGTTRSIGVINYCEGSLKCLLETAKVKPAINYYMVHVGMGQNPTLLSLRKFCDENGIRTFGYGAVGEPGPNAELFKSPILTLIGKNHGDKAPEEVALRWVIQGGAAVSVRPTTNFGLGFGVCTGAGTNGECAKGLGKRAGVFDWKLTEKEMAELTAMAGPDDNPTLFSSAGCPGAYGT